VNPERQLVLLEHGDVEAAQLLLAVRVGEDLRVSFGAEEQHHERQHRRRIELQRKLYRQRVTFHSRRLRASDVRIDPGLCDRRGPRDRGDPTHQFAAVGHAHPEAVALDDVFGRRR